LHRELFRHGALSNSMADGSFERIFLDTYPIPRVRFSE
jgi:hypothetical protein